MAKRPSREKIIYILLEALAAIVESELADRRPRRQSHSKPYKKKRY